MLIVSSSIRSGINLTPKSGMIYIYISNDIVAACSRRMHGCLTLVCPFSPHNEDVTNHTSLYSLGDSPISNGITFSCALELPTFE